MGANASAPSAASLRALDTQGVTVVRGAWGAGQLATLQRAYEKQAAIVERVTATTPPKERRYEEDGKPVRSRYWVHRRNYILECGPGRRDSNIGFSHGVFASPMFLANPAVTGLVAATLQDGRTPAGLVAGETGSSLTLLGLDGTEQTILRGELRSLMSSGRSLMPEGLEAAVDEQAMADLVAFLAASR